MPEFRTALSPTPAPFQIEHGHTMLLLGSCFSEHIGDRLAQHKFCSLANPFGIAYNPVSIARCLVRVAAGEPFFQEEELFANAGLWHSWEHHGRFSQPERPAALAGINAAYAKAIQHLKTTDFLFLSLGTAEVSALLETGQIVANNHKMPAALFDSRRLSTTEIEDSLAAVLQKIQARLGGLQVILTVSPVRHLRKGLVENQRSKAALLLACDALSRQLPFVHYFPAYEIFLDDLRDYRFYAADLLHPSETALHYVWEFFSETYFSESTRRLNERIERIRLAAAHRPFHPDTAQHRAFVQTQLEAIEKLKQEFPSLDFSAEQEHFSAFL